MFGFSGETVLVVSRGDQVSFNTTIGGWWGSRYARSNVDMAFFPTAYDIVKFTSFKFTDFKNID